MKLNHQDLLSSSNKLFHVSEEAGISIFEPRPSPSYIPGITGDVVFAVSGKLLHNYLLPRDCPRVTFYPTDKTTAADKAEFMGNSLADYMVIVESEWYKRIQEATLILYEFPADEFHLVDECAGYYVSYKAITPLAVHTVKDVMTAMLERNVELRFTPTLTNMADAVKSSSLNFSLIRMRNAKP
jgi:hypothetical protein